MIIINNNNNNNNKNRLVFSQSKVHNFFMYIILRKNCLSCSWELKHEMIFILFKFQITIYKDFKAFNNLILLTVYHTVLVL